MGSEQYAIVPAPSGDFVELSSATAPSRATGRVFRKQILKFGDLRYKGGTYKIDEAFADKMVENFRSVGEIVHAPKAGPRNEHNDDPDRNIGEVIDVFKTDKGIYADIDVRTDDADKMGKTLLGVSGLIALNHEDRNTGKLVGPTLLHACITNRPHVTNLEPFQEVLAMSDSSVDILNDAIVLTDQSEEDDVPQTREELIEALKKDHNVDVVAALSAQTELETIKPQFEVVKPQAEAYAALTSKISESFAGNSDVLALSAGSAATTEEFLTTVENAANQIVSLSAEVDTLNLAAEDAAAESEVDKLVLTGYILPAKKDWALKLRKKDKELFEESIPDQPVIRLSVEDGEQEIEVPGVTAQSEIDRISAIVPSAAA